MAEFTKESTECHIDMLITMFEHLDKNLILLVYEANQRSLEGTIDGLLQLSHDSTNLSESGKFKIVSEGISNEVMETNDKEQQDLPREEKSQDDIVAKDAEIAKKMMEDEIEALERRVRGTENPEDEILARNLQRRYNRRARNHENNQEVAEWLRKNTSEGQNEVQDESIFTKLSSKFAQVREEWCSTTQADLEPVSLFAPVPRENVAAEEEVPLTCQSDQTVPLKDENRVGKDEDNNNDKTLWGSLSSLVDSFMG
eukprot:TRINITY_DN1451_c0_g2_i5.p1 TRINITY_DN1451_c0_g2~~TRINITY_DN1451_c0_g2_i5.p1  ORF type:complete len:256 (-),score=58.01 TRINITY_DN1451_c0_g2_i5:300-1067(-)